MTLAMGERSRLSRESAGVQASLREIVCMTELSAVVRSGFEEVCKAFTLSAKQLGFTRTRKRFWTRPHAHTVDFVHFHRLGSSYGSPRNASIDIRVHFGIRVFNDVHPGSALNGPHSSAELLRAGRYHLRFNAATGSTRERCLMDLERFLVEVGEPWFQSFLAPESLLERVDSPLRAQEKALLQAALCGNATAENVSASRREFGL